MLGPSALATPQAHIAQFGSSASAALKARAASASLNAYDCSRPRTNSCCAAGTALTTGVSRLPKPSSTGARALRSGKSKAAHEPSKSRAAGAERALKAKGERRMIGFRQEVGPYRWQARA